MSGVAGVFRKAVTVVENEVNPPVPEWVQQVAQMRPAPEQSAFEPEDLTPGEQVLFQQGGATSVAWARGMAKVVEDALSRGKAV